MSGVLRSEATAHDFTMVRRVLTKSLGTGNNSIVWTRIEYRASVTADGWYRGSHATIADEVGMSVNMVRTALKSLVAGGFLEAKKQHVGGAYDQTTSYRPIWAETQMEEGSSPHLDLGLNPDDSSPETSKTSREPRSHSVAPRRQPRKKSSLKPMEPAEDDTSTGGDDEPPVLRATKRKRTAPSPDPAPGTRPNSGGMAARLARGLNELEQGERVNVKAVGDNLTRDRAVTGGPTAEVQNEMVDTFIRSWKMFVRPGAVRAPLWRVFLNNRVRLREQVERVLAVQWSEDVTKTAEWAEWAAQARREEAEYEAQKAAEQ